MVYDKHKGVCGLIDDVICRGCTLPSYLSVFYIHINNYGAM